MRILLFLSIFTFACATPTNPTTTPTDAVAATDMRPECISKRAAFDIGSGETRLNVSKVNICNNKIIATELELKERIPYKETMTKGKGKYLSQATMQAGFKALQSMKMEAAKFSPDTYLGVATAAFREARNGKTFIDEVNKSLKINAKIISQKDEASIGYYAALTMVKNPKANLVVWDIGGSSQQIITKKTKDFIVYEGKLASVSFKDRVLSEVKKQKDGSPNPLDSTQMKDSILLAEIFATNDVPNDVKKVFAEPNVQVVGIGGVHYYSLLKQSKPASQSNLLTIADVEATSLELTGKDNTYFADQKHVNTTITNVALVLGFMKALDVKAIEVYNVNLSHGLLVHPTLWDAPAPSSVTKQ
jgi:exopolyphosphatase/guanosine-5'-triphosphate,3'-diphosphate pyrophosphatase